MGFSLRSLGRAIDPTNKNSALGGLTRSAINAIPGGSAVMGVVDGVNSGRQPTDRGGVPADSAAQPSPSSSMPDSRGAVAWYRKPAVLIGAAASVVVLLLALVFMRRRSA